MDCSNVRIHAKEVPAVIALLSILVDSYEEGACFLLTDREKITFSISEKVNLPGVAKGSPIIKGGLAEKILQSDKILLTHVDENVYGVSSDAFGGPIWSDDDFAVVGTFLFLLPKQHK